MILRVRGGQISTSYSLEITLVVIDDWSNTQPVYLNSAQIVLRRSRLNRAASMMPAGNANNSDVMFTLLSAPASVSACRHIRPSLHSILGELSLLPSWDDCQLLGWVVINGHGGSGGVTPGQMTLAPPCLLLCFGNRNNVNRK